jgi:hypothetical protein
LQKDHTDVEPARLVLFDCEESLLELMKSKEDTLRRRWVATVSLLRSVGHVLDKVDGEASPTHRAVIDDLWPQLKRSDIFAGFIDDERNNVLKQYRFAVGGTSRSARLEDKTARYGPPLQICPSDHQSVRTLVEIRSRLFERRSRSGMTTSTTSIAASQKR